jgi:hypothetical protein
MPIRRGMDRLQVGVRCGHSVRTFGAAAQRRTCDVSRRAASQIAEIRALWVVLSVSDAREGGLASATFLEAGHHVLSSSSTSLVVGRAVGRSARRARHDGVELSPFHMVLCTATVALSPYPRRSIPVIASQSAVDRRRPAMATTGPCEPAERLRGCADSSHPNAAYPRQGRSRSP